MKEVVQLPEGQNVHLKHNSIMILSGTEIQEIMAHLHTSSPCAKPCNAHSDGMAMHNSFEKQDSIHGDAIYSGLSLYRSRAWKMLCLSIASVLLYAFGGRGQRLQTLAHGCYKIFSTSL
jgi:hypothetical protein